ncbi:MULTISPECIES: hypothetical protein [Clostridia]|uniref:hypothetical protein n=1 Tax=Clostridia TaxID=186801 RepID=UPI000EA12725|nr:MULTISPECIES: hypothetical protein [Clostridia]NBJ69067.1 hypothetical protein [Roseburia sp. 1XD42-34]RKI79494.1 hypothetical protein D7V87_06200 [Clostridium sp. 1xD42-85]
MKLLSATPVFIYSIFIASTLLLSLIHNFRDRWIPFVYMSIILTIASPLAAFLFIIRKPSDMNGFMYILTQLWDGNVVAFIVVVIHLYLIFSLGLFLKDSLGERFTSCVYLLSDKLKLIMETRKISNKGKKEKQE